MQVQTNALILSSIKFGDTSLIVKCFTEQFGIKSYLLKGILSAKRGKLKAAYFQSLMQLELTANHNNKGNLNSIKEVQVNYAYNTLHTYIVKQSIGIFLAEMLVNAIREEEANKGMYSYISTSLQWLDLHDEIASFHLIFLLNLTKYLGFYPDELGAEKPYFNLAEGQFFESTPLQDFISGSHLDLFRMFLGTNFGSVIDKSLNKYARQRMLEILVRYYELHLIDFKKPKSIQVLKELFS